jgi:hypothetical protein
MAATVVQAGSGLKMINESGAVTDLVLPAGIVLRTDVKPRWCVSNNYLVLVNTPSEPLIIDATGKVRILSPKAPRLAPVMSAVAGGTLSGVYAGVRYTFRTRDANGNIISESDYSPAGNSQAVAAQFLKAANLDLSPDEITERVLYRPTSGGSVLFQWVTLDGNIQTVIQDDLSDAGLSLFGAPILGTPPHLTMIAEFRGRLWGVGDIDVDHVRYTEAGVQYAWPSDNLIAVPQVGSDIFGVTGLAARREALGIGRRNMLLQVTGSGAEDADGIPDFDMVILSKELGIESQESVCIFRDTAYFLWKDGVYAWNSEGIKCVSDGKPDGRGSVRAWFATDSYFNRDKFSVAFAHVDKNRPVYRLFLCSAGSTTIDSWVELDLNEGTWWGPHSTALFTPISAFNRSDATDRNIPLIGTDAYVYQDKNTRTDGAATAITFDVIGKRHDMQDPDVEKYFGELSLLGEAQSGGLLTVKTRAGNLNATQAITQYWDMRKNRQKIGRAGRGKHMQVELINAEVGRDIQLFGYEVDPVNLIGRR